MAINVVLVEPEIPPNTGNIARTCAATGATLHLVEPLGFSIDDKHMKRAGLDYWEHVNIVLYKSLDEFMQKHGNEKLFLATTKGNQFHTEVKYEENCYILFGKETKGLPKQLIEENMDKAIKIPMGKSSSLRSLNLSNAAAVIIYEAYRQLGYQNFI